MRYTACISRYFTRREAIADVLLLLCLAIAWIYPRLGENILSPIERAAQRFAAKKRLAIALMAFAPIVLRVPLLWLMPVPVPAIHDEFSYLLAADTFAHGRLTNPPHPMWIYFETIHVNMHPTYMSKYPPAQSAVLALGQVLGHPWIGVMLGVSAMCAATLWMLQGWFPSHWALLGATLLLFRLGIFSYWINSYWGGAVAAAGGALVMGALPRIFRSKCPRARHTLLLGLGAAILANSRPFEGFVFFLPVIVVLVIWLLRSHRPSWQVALRRVVFPLGVTLLLAAVFVGYYNWRVTGNVLLPPYIVNDRAYNTSPTFFWQAAPPPMHYLNPQFEYFYNGWARPYWERNSFHGVRSVVTHSARVIAKFVYFFLWPELCVAFLALPRIVGDRRVRFPIVVSLCGLLGLLAVVWSEPHYAAPFICVFFALLVQAFRHLRRWKFHGRPVGIGLTRAIVVFSAGMLVVYAAEALRNPYSASYVAPVGVWSNSGNRERVKIEQRLSALPGNHIAIVRYAPEKSTAGEWVYNRADIDHAKIVWAREIPGRDIRPLLDYFRGRQFWLVEPDEFPARLTPY